MLEFKKKFSVNEKLVFRLYPELAAESYTLLVKKVKENLVAAVISNNDKNSVELKVNDEIFLFSEAQGEKWVTKAFLMQRHSYPLVILSVAQEPWPLAQEVGEKPSSPDGDVESTDQAGFAGFNVDSQAGAAPIELDENDDDLASVPSITIRELNAEPTRASGQEAMRLGVEDLDGLPDIDTSELEAELKTDIEDMLEKGRVSFIPPHSIEDETALAEPLTAGMQGEAAEDDGIDGMTIEQGGSLAIGSFDEDDVAEPVAEKLAEPEEPELLETDIGEPVAEPGEPDDEESLYMPEAENDTPAEPDLFQDFFTVYLTPVEDWAAEPVGLDADISPGAKRALDALTERLERLEGALSSISGGGITVPPIATPSTASSRIAVVLGGLTEDGFKVVMEDAPISGERFIVEMEKQWRPPLFLKAVAVAESSLSINDILLVRFRFEGLDRAGRMAVWAYLDGRAGYFKSLTDAVKASEG